MQPSNLQLDFSPYRTPSYSSAMKRNIQRQHYNLVTKQELRTTEPRTYDTEHKDQTHNLKHPAQNKRPY